MSYPSIDKASPDFVGTFPIATDQFMPDPDVTVYKSNMGGSQYAVADGANAFGKQAALKLFTRGEDDQGLLVTIARASLKTFLSNGVVPTVTRDNSDAFAFVYSAANKTLVGNVRNATTMSALKARVDAIANLSSVYFGGEDGTGLAGDGSEESSGATADDYCWVYIVMDGDAFAYFGEASPSNNNGSNYIASASNILKRVMRPGHQVWLRRVGSSDVRGSISVWRR